MSYRCDTCGSVVPQGGSLIRKVVETRDVEYTNAEGKVIGKGTEIVREMHLCASCASPTLQLETVNHHNKQTRKAAAPPRIQKSFKPFNDDDDGKPSRQHRRKKEAA